MQLDTENELPFASELKKQQVRRSKSREPAFANARSVMPTHPGRDVAYLKANNLPGGKDQSKVDE